MADCPSQRGRGRNQMFEIGEAARFQPSAFSAQLLNKFYDFSCFTCKTSLQNTKKSPIKNLFAGIQQDSTYFRIGIVLQAAVKIENHG